MARPVSPLPSPLPASAQYQTLSCPHCGQSPPSLWPHKEGSREDGEEALLPCPNPALGHGVKAGLLIVGQAGGCGLVVAVQLLSRVLLTAIPWTAARQASVSVTNSWSLLTLMSIESMMPSNQPLILYRALLLLPSIFPNTGSFPMSRLFASGGQSIGSLWYMASWLLPRGEGRGLAEDPQGFRSKRV